MIFNPSPKKQILDFSKLKEVVDDNFELDENGRMISKKVENNWEKEKLLVTIKQGLVLERIKIGDLNPIGDLILKSFFCTALGFFPVIGVNSQVFRIFLYKIHYFKFSLKILFSHINLDLCFLI